MYVRSLAPMDTSLASTRVAGAAEDRPGEGTPPAPAPLICHPFCSSPQPLPPPPPLTLGTLVKESPRSSSTSYLATPSTLPPGPKPDSTSSQETLAEESSRSPPTSDHAPCHPSRDPLCRGVPTAARAPAGQQGGLARTSSSHTQPPPRRPSRAAS